MNVHAGPGDLWLLGADSSGFLSAGMCWELYVHYCCELVIGWMSIASSLLPSFMLAHLPHLHAFHVFISSTVSSPHLPPPTARATAAWSFVRKGKKMVLVVAVAVPVLLNSALLWRMNALRFLRC
ncbi:unnamed protein product [Discosporangium mesarthrocarpum]